MRLPTMGASNHEANRRKSIKNLNEPDFDSNEKKLVYKPIDDNIVEAMSKDMIQQLNQVQKGGGGLMK